MSTVRDLHNQAMVFAQRAMVERESGRTGRAQALAAEALPLEVEAATLISKTPQSEPTRSILYRSAASLAYQSGDYAAAQRLVAEGLAGYPPATVEQELKDLFEQINFATHLQLRNATLDGAQMQLAIVGNDVGSGQVPYAVFHEHITAAIALLDRTMRRLMGETYSRGRGKRQSRPFVPLISAPRAGSFAVTIEVAPRKDLPLSYMATGTDVIERVINGMKLVQGKDFDELKHQIQDDKYYINFVSLAQKLAPDGERVRMVGLTSPTGEVSLTTTKGEVAAPLLEMQEGTISAISGGVRTYRGVLDEASTRGNDRVGLTTQDQTRMTLLVREGMDDLVRSYFNRQVEVSVQHTGNTNTLVGVKESDEQD